MRNESFRSLPDRQRIGDGRTFWETSGENALDRLIDVARSDTGQARRVSHGGMVTTAAIFLSQTRSASMG